MSIQPQGEEIRKTVKWVSEQKIDHPEKKLNEIIEQACIMFNLSPKDSDFLARFLAEEKG